MKLRSTKNSIRIRIRKSELENLRNNQIIEEFINFGSNIILTFALAIDETATLIIASLEDNYLKVVIPAPMATKWIDTDQVGLETTYCVGNRNMLHLLIEKDFPCLDRPEEDKSDTFQELALQKEDQC